MIEENKNYTKKELRTLFRDAMAEATAEFAVKLEEEAKEQHKDIPFEMSLSTILENAMITSMAEEKLFGKGE